MWFDTVGRELRGREGGRECERGECEQEVNVDIEREEREGR